MKLPDGTTLMHGKAPYDPRKAHEYYLRTRELKGRKKGGLQPAMGRKMSAKPTMGAKTAPATYTVTVRGRTAKLTAKQLKEQKAYAAERVTSIKKKLAQLNAELKKRVVEAMRAAKEAEKPDTAAEKAESARESKQYRDKHKQELKNKGKKAASETKEEKPDGIAELKETIAGVQKSLAAAVERQRALTSATKNG